MSAAHTTDRRSATRFLPAGLTFCRTGAGDGLVWNLSATGLGMMIPFPPEAGRLLAVELSNHAASRFLVATVAHVRPMQAGDHFVGLRFARPLDADELHPFVEPAGLTAA